MMGRELASGLRFCCCWFELAIWHAKTHTRSLEAGPGDERCENTQIDPSPGAGSHGVTISSTLQSL